MKRATAWMALGLGFTALAGAVAAADMAAVIHDRQAHYKEIGKASKAIYDSLNSPAPALPLIQADARQIAQLAPLVPSWFPVGSGPEAGVKTGAKAGIWLHPADFKADTASFALEAGKFNKIAATGDLNAIRAEFPVLSKTCKTCHEQFRQKD
jgi:cytochrome c556